MTIARIRILAVIGILLAVFPASSAQAAVAYNWPAGQAGLQNYGGSVGMDFTVYTAIDVTALGVFDNLGDGFSGTLVATIWDLGTGTAVPGATATFDGADPGTLDGGARFKTIPTVNLPPGSYSIASSGHGDPDFVYNPALNTTTDDGGGVICFTGGRRYRADGTFPDTVDVPGYYGGGTFEFSDTLPPPATFDGDIIAYQINAPQAGNQDFGGSVGMDFVVNSPIFVNALGAADADQDGMQATITVELWSRNDGGTPDDPSDDTGGLTLATETFSADDSGTLVGGSRLKSLGAALELQPGAYTINAHGYGADELLPNSGIICVDKQTNDGDGLLSFVGRSRYGVTAGLFPDVADVGPADRFAAGTFAFAAVPEPSTVALIAAGIVCMLGFHWRRKRSA